MKISRFVNDPQKPFHSSGYAEVAHAGLIGSTSAQTFAQRERINRSRQAIMGYRESHIGRAYNSVRSRLNEIGDRPPQIRVPERGDQRSKPGNGAASAPGTPGMAPPQQPRRVFTEPQQRGYNPYQ